MARGLASTEARQTLRQPREMLPVSPKRGGTGFEVSAVEKDPFGDDDMGFASVTHETGPRTYDLRKRFRLRSQVALNW